jgi:hypothetical protein
MSLEFCEKPLQYCLATLSHIQSLQWLIINEEQNLSTQSLSLTTTCPNSAHCNELKKGLEV